MVLKLADSLAGTAEEREHFIPSSGRVMATHWARAEVTAASRERLKGPSGRIAMRRRGQKSLEVNAEEFRRGPRPGREVFLWPACWRKELHRQQRACFRADRRMHTPSNRR